MNKNRYKISKYLYLDEIVDVKTYAKYNSKGKLYRLANKVDNQLIKAFDLLREEMGEAGIINNWWGIFIKNNYNVNKTYLEVESRKDIAQWRGLRPPRTPYYSVDSQHTEFKGFDVIFKSGANKARQLIKLHWKIWGITAIEIGVSWLHMDTRYIYNQQKLYKFNA